jgi:hypothetical protein
MTTTGKKPMTLSSKLAMIWVNNNLGFTCKFLIQKMWKMVTANEE